MEFKTPDGIVSFEIPDQWWSFAEMSSFSPTGGGFFPYQPDTNGRDIVVVPLTDIKPPLRAANVPSFKKYKLVPILFAFLSPECALPPVEVNSVNPATKYRFQVYNGYHRYYASLAAGFTKLPVVIRQAVT
jgi:hypothetical protein